MRLFRVTVMLFIITALVVTTGATLVAAGDVSKAEKAEIQDAMKKYVTDHTAESGTLPVVYQGKVLVLTLHTSEKYPDGFHSSVVNEGELFASCADFIDTRTNTKYDIDFLVNQVDGQYLVVQPIVHSIDGKKTPYDLSH